MLRPLLYLAIFCAAWNVNAQSCRIEPIGKPVSTYIEGDRALDAVIRPLSISDDPAGNIYFYDAINLRIFKIATDGTIHTVAGNGHLGSDGDGGLAIQARISVRSLVVSPEGVIYFSDSSRIRRIQQNGIIQTVAGTGIAAFNRESGPALSIHLNGPIGLHYGKDQSLYFADQNNNRIRKLTPDDQVITIAGSMRDGNLWVDGQPAGYDPDEGDGGPATSAYVPSPRSVFFLPDGQIAFSDVRSGGRVRIVDQEGMIRTIYRSHREINFQVDPDGILYVAISDAGRIERKQLLLNGEELTPSVWPVLPGRENKDFPNPAYSYTLLPSGRVSYVFSSSLGYYSQQLWVSTSNQLHPVAGRKLVIDPIENGPISSTSLVSVGSISSDRNGGFFFRRDAVIYHVDAQQQVRRFYGGGTLAGDPDGKNPLDVQGTVLDMFVLGPNEIIVATSDNGFRVYRVTAEKVTVVRSANGDPVNFPVTLIPSRKIMSVDANGTIYVLLPTALPPFSNIDDTRVITVNQSSNVSSYSMYGSYYPERLADGRVVSIPYEQFRPVYHLNAEGLGERTRGLEGSQFIKIVQIGDEAYVQTTSTNFLFQKNINSDAWKKIDLNQLTLDSNAPVLLLGASEDGSLIFSSRTGTNLVKIIDPENCPSISSPTVKKNSLINSANYAKPDTLAPGQLFTIFGENMGPAENYGFLLSPAGNLVNPSVGTSILFQYMYNLNLFSYPTTLIFGNNSQVNLQLNNGAAFLKEVSFSTYLQWEGISIPYSGEVKIVNTNPGLFVINGGRDGQGAILNQDYSVNSSNNPATTGSVVSLYGTGLGEYDRPLYQSITPSDPLPRVKATVTVRISGKNAEVLYAGGSPGSITGLNQINVRIPEGVSGPEVEVELDADGVSTSGTQRVTLAVQ